jgi:hypothetical protein
MYISPWIYCHPGLSAKYRLVQHVTVKRGHTVKCNEEQLMTYECVIDYL